MLYIFTDFFFKILFRLELLTENGIYNFWVDETIRMNSPRDRGGIFAEGEDKYTFSKLDFDHLKGIFAVFFFLCIVSVIFFLGEILVSIIKMKSLIGQRQA